jgi:hypothetical protein
MYDPFLELFAVPERCNPLFFKHLLDFRHRINSLETVATAFVANEVGRRCL